MSEIYKKKAYKYKTKYLKLKRQMADSINYRKHLSQPWFTLIKNGSKQYEGRIYDGDWAKMKVGDTITFFNNDNNETKEYTVTISEIKKFGSFKEAINSVGLEKVLPTEIKNTVEQAIENIYYKYYKPEIEKKFGIVLFKFNL
jgi:ASC-1-like (ASCH) protein